MSSTWDVIIIGGGIAGLSAAVYLGRALRSTLIIDEGKSMASWEPHVENYLGFPESISGDELLRRGREQAEKYKTVFISDRVEKIHKRQDLFVVQTDDTEYVCKRLLLATGIYHEPPDLEGAKDCLGRSMFFCKDCDAFKIQGQRIIIYGHSNESVEYALAMLNYSLSTALVTDGKQPKWDEQHSIWLSEYKIPIYTSKIIRMERETCSVRKLQLENGFELDVDALFVTRGDIYFNQLARDIGAKVDKEGEIMIDACLQTTVKGLYAAGCVTPANCQMIIAAGQGALAAQSINRDLFEESLNNHSLREIIHASI